MGENEGWAEPVEPLPNGLLPRADPVMRALDAERWMKAEKRTAELIACIQPNKLSEERRNAVADYVQRLIMKCFPCQVCTFGSVPLKTYLPDGDIDLTAFSQNPNLRDTWANQVRDMLSSEEKNENAEFHVKEVQYIQAEVPLIKCLVENIVVDISFNQVGGLCTLCFLDEVDILINQNHLFKRSIILIKAWCYYESRILGAHHGLISTYALETLVLYIFHVFNNSFHGPLEVLYHFLEFFSNFDWDNFCVSLWGPVPIKSLPDVTAESPRKDSQELLLSKLFLDACSTVYAVFPGGQENNGQQFVPKNFNVIDPLRSSNNLGRSVNRGNFFRIRSAFAFGAKKLARLLDCPKENVNFEVNQFFMNTWERHGSGNRPDAPGVDLRRHLTSSTPDRLHEFQNSNWKKAKENSNAHGLEAEGPHTHDVSSQHVKTSSRMMPMENELYSASLTQNLKSQFSFSSIQSNDQIVRDLVPNQVVPNDKIQRDMNADHLVSDGQRRFTFARTHSSPELTDNYSDTTSQVQFNRHGGSAGHATYSTADFSNRWRNLGSETRVSHGSCSSVEETVARNVLSSQRIDAADSTSCKPLNEEFPTSSGAQLMHQEEQDIVNMMASASFQGYNGQVHLPINLTSGHLPYSIPPFLASMGYGQQNFPGFVPTNYPLLDPSFSHVQFSHGLVSPQLTQYFPGVGLNASEDSVERGNDFFCRVDSREAENEFPVEHDAGSSGGYDPEYGNLDSVSSDDKVPASLSGLKYVPPPSRGSGSSVAWRVQQRHPRERHGAIRENIDGSSMHDNRGSELYVEDKSARPSSASHSNSMRSRTSSEGSWDGSSVKGPKTTKEKRGKKMLHTDPSVSHGKGKTMSEHMSNDTDDDDQDWGSLSNMTETVERNSGSEPDAPLHVSRHPFSGYEVAQTSGSDSMVPFAPMLLGSGSGQRMNDNSGLIAFYPTGPPIPFLTMLPVYNIPPKTGTSEATSGHFGGHETLGNSESLINIISKGSDTSEELTSSSSLRGGSTNETSVEQKTDILNSDFASHLQSLQIGRVCQNLRYQGPLIYPSPVMVPPIYIQGRLPYDNPGIPLSSNINVLSQLVTNYGQRLVPVAPIQSVSSRQPNIYQSYVDDMPRYRSGTGTYLPNPKIPVRERHSSGSRRGNYNHDRNDNFGDREGKGNANSKSRAAARSHNRSQSDKSNSRTDRFAYSEGRADRVWNSNKHNSIPSYQSQNGLFRSNISQNGPQNVAYNMYPLAAMNPNGVSNGPSVPPLVMLYPFDNNATYGSHSEQLEFGSLGPVGFPDINELSQLYDGTRARAVEDHRLHGSSVQCSSPDQPSSPHHLRRV